MSLHGWRYQMAQMAQAAAAGVMTVRLAVVTSVDPKAYAAKVQLQPPPADGDAPETGWLPVWSPWVGNGWGFYALPAVGDQVLTVFQEGDSQAGIVLGALYSDEDRPLETEVGEFWLQHEGGAFIKLLNDGSIASKGTWNHDGDVSVTGKITASGIIKSLADVLAKTISLFGHHHTDPQGGSVGDPT